jgi:hypothetical protein
MQRGAALFAILRCLDGDQAIRLQWSFVKPEQQRFDEDLRWMSQRVQHVADLTLKTVLDYLPVFERCDFGGNEYLDQIIRRPYGPDERTIPVGAVSKRYFLIQHFEMVQSLSRGLEGVGIKPEAVPTELWISEYGERIRIQCRCLNRPFDPGDDFPLVLSAECFNSVDKSCALEVRMFWLRLACMNGLSIKENAVLRKIHDAVWMNREDPGQFVRDQLSHADVHFAVIREWMNHRTNLDMIAKWVDRTVADQWTNEAAARVYHICSVGFDGTVAQPKAGTPPHMQPVSSDKLVSGACAPVGTVYHAAQALSWVASRRSSVDDQIGWARQIHRLVEKLEFVK